MVLAMTGCSKEDNSSNIETPPPTEDQYDVTVDLKMPGTLASNIPNKEFKTIKINGSLNGTDIKFIRGVIQSLSLIDLEDANIVEGGDSYYNITHKTQNNIIGRFMFTELEGKFDLILPKSIISIKDEAFLSCKGLKSVVLNKTLNEIGPYSFSGCTQLSSITIPERITTLERETFKDCESLEIVQLPSNLSKIGILAFNNCKKLKNINFPNKLKSIEANAFENCTNLTEIILPNLLITIEQAAFNYCTSLRRVTLPANITKIGDAAFMLCTSLTEMVLPNSITTLGNYAFHGCKNLNSIILPTNITELNIGLLEGTNISSISIPENVQSIKGKAFSKCENLTSIHIPKNVSIIGDSNPFEHCSKLTTFTVDEENKYYSNIDGVLTSKDKSILKYYPSGNTATTYNIPDNIIEIGPHSFVGCNNIKRVNIPSSVKSIRENAFAASANIKEIHCKSITPPITPEYGYIFPFARNTESLYVPVGSADKYKKSTWEWEAYFKNIIEE